jgi:Fe-S cluster assembly protein SufD
MVTARDDLLQHYELAWQAYFDPDAKGAGAKGWLPSLRRQQLDAFLDKGFPTARDEHWKYIDLAALKARLFEFSAPLHAVHREQIEKHLLPVEHYRLVFVDGFFEADFSLLPNQEEFTAINLANVIPKQEAIKKYITPSRDSSAFMHLNTACVQDGAFIVIPANCSVDRPIHLLFLTSSTSNNTLQNIRNIIVTEHHAHLTLLEEHQSLSEDSCWVNVVTQLFSNESAQIEYVKFQNQNTCSFHFSAIESLQRQHSQLSLHNYSLGSRLARDELQGFLAGGSAALQLQELYLPFKTQHITMHSSITHQADATVSEVLSRGIVAGKSSATFKGKIKIEKNIKQVAANLQNKNLLLAKDAEVNAKPELEVHSDDVRSCKHGAVMGRIDEEMLFYLRSRGIPQAHAYQLLLLAFAHCCLSAISHQAIVDKLLFAVTHHCKEMIHA